MTYAVTTKTELKRIRDEAEFKIKYIISEDNIQKYCALVVNKNGNPIVYDLTCDIYIHQHNWYVNGSGYGYTTTTENGNGKYMHRWICTEEKIKGIEDTTLSVDHIDREKLDNRIKNLRMATQAQQNSNRDTRCDKIAPCQELIDADVKSLPKYVRWDNSEKKFIIEKHPYLMNEVKQGIRKRPEQSGSKSIKLTIIQKYQDILARLEVMDNVINNDPELDAIRIQNKKEYDDICDCIKAYEGVEIEEKEPESVQPVVAKRNTVAGRKTVSKLPPDCGVTAEELPKYCYYKPACATRSDMFVIDKHPALDVRQWATTGASNKTTKQKFDMLIEKYKTLTITPV